MRLEDNLPSKEQLEKLEDCQGLVLYFNPHQADTMTRLSAWKDAIVEASPSVGLGLTIDTAPLSDEKRNAFVEFCLDCQMEFIEWNEARPSDADPREVFGVRRVLESLKNNMWPSMEMKKPGEQASNEVRGFENKLPAAFDLFGEDSEEEGSHDDGGGSHDDNGNGYDNDNDNDNGNGNGGEAMGPAEVADSLFRGLDATGQDRRSEYAMIPEDESLVPDAEEDDEEEERMIFSRAKPSEPLKAASLFPSATSASAPSPTSTSTSPSPLTSTSAGAASLTTTSNVASSIPSTSAPKPNPSHGTPSSSTQTKSSMANSKPQGSTGNASATKNAPPMSANDQMLKNLTSLFDMLKKEDVEADEVEGGFSFEKAIMEMQNFKSYSSTLPDAQRREFAARVAIGFAKLLGDEDDFEEDDDQLKAELEKDFEDARKKK